ncbi:hypothetical protein D3C87_1444320 [compost metagenome]
MLSVKLMSAMPKAAGKSSVKVESVGNLKGGSPCGMVPTTEIPFSSRFSSQDKNISPATTINETGKRGNIFVRIKKEPKQTTATVRVGIEVLGMLRTKD